MAEMCNMTMRIEILNVKTKTSLISKIICSKNAKRFPIMGHVYTLGKNILHYYNTDLITFLNTIITMLITTPKNHGINEKHQ